MKADPRVRTGRTFMLAAALRKAVFGTQPVKLHSNQRMSLSLSGTNLGVNTMILELVNLQQPKDVG